MGARYSDRFFGPAGRTGEPLASTPVTIDLVEGSDVGAAPSAVPAPVEELFARPRAWHDHPAARAALVGALLVGAGGGAYGWGRWREHQVEAAARSAVFLTASAAVASFNESGTEFEVDLMLENDGAFPLRVIDVSALDGRLMRTDGEWERVELWPGDGLRRAVGFAIDCSVAGGEQLTTSTAGLTAQLATVDGASHDQQLAVDYHGATMSTLLDEQCTVNDGYAGYSSLYAEVVDAEPVGDDAVAATILLHSPYAAAVAAMPQTYNVVPAGSGFSTVIDHSIDEPASGSWVVRVVWTVRDCPLALAATDMEMNVELTGQMATEPTAGSLVSLPSPSLTVALARLSERVCG